MREAKRRYRALYLPPLGVPAEEARAAIEDELERAGYWRGGAARRTMLRRPRGRAGAVAVAAVAALCVGGGLGAANAARRAHGASVASPTTTATVEAIGNHRCARAGAVGCRHRARGEAYTEAEAKPVPKPQARPKPAPNASDDAGRAARHDRARGHGARDDGTEGDDRARAGAEGRAATEGAARAAAPRPDGAERLDHDSAGRAHARGDDELRFAASEAGASFACRLDDGAWQPARALADSGLSLSGRTSSPSGQRIVPGTPVPLRHASGPSPRRPTRRRPR